MIRKEAWNRFLQLVSDGNSINDSATASRIDRQTVYARRYRDPEFARAMDQALIKTKTDAIQTIKRAWKNQWQAAGWWLERRHPDEFAIKNKLEMNFNFQKSDKFDDIDDEKIIEVLSDKRIEIESDAK